MPIELKERGDALENEYFRRQEQELIAKMKAKLEADDAAATQMNCPSCDGKLIETQFENVIIDVCEKCSGAWFGAAELAQIRAKDENKSGWFSRLFE
jgi:ribosomal protein L37AE/L43A